MPVIVKDCEWTQTDDSVEVVVPLKGKAPPPSAVFTSDTYIKVNFPPFLFELDLLHPIDEAESKAVISKGVAKFQLKKQTPGAWEQLAYKTEDKAALRQRRLKAEEGVRQRAAEQAETKSKEQYEKQRAAVQRQMKLEEEERRRRQEKQDAARSAVDDALAQGIAATSISAQTSSPPPPPPPSSSSTSATTLALTTTAPSTASSLPPVRRAGKISVTFSHRAFKTPERETYKEQEQQWLDKQAAARKAIAEAKGEGGVEHDPLWYIDKGRSFFRAGDCQSAINAFTSAVTLDKTSATAFSLRAACHLRLCDYQACAADATKALSLLQPPCSANAGDRLKAHLRRAAALEAINDTQAALFDYRKALELQPHDARVRAHIAELTGDDGGDGGGGGVQE
ncbi:hypothetical protein PTSG_08307 [Salpingoeca rosetta]|uniref:Dynein axonemal assembly factor 4 n=1 Tax=Salpingoeca rosetta (strain ATCC 50818 / BSB-021) TaxID=946362 RepID=F2UJB6_SALR5|nr:uncharacterized protein PTSG_08307 [Salpingoeca rosetta]EGD77215.1 hypothetical protein PTSG_08307 [Salpingoeca rosetta]|eukprot:XP_004990559.1 hypothetical protein PTSG_08307 [Salpingoeca rosetta]